MIVLFKTEKEKQIQENECDSKLKVCFSINWFNLLQVLCLKIHNFNKKEFYKLLKITSIRQISNEKNKKTFYFEKLSLF